MGDKNKGNMKGLEKWVNSEDGPEEQTKIVGETLGYQEGRS